MLIGWMEGWVSEWTNHWVAKCVGIFCIHYWLGLFHGVSILKEFKGGSCQSNPLSSMLLTDLAPTSSLWSIERLGTVHTRNPVSTQESEEIRGFSKMMSSKSNRTLWLSAYIWSRYVFMYIVFTETNNVLTSLEKCLSQISTNNFKLHQWHRRTCRCHLQLFPLCISPESRRTNTTCISLFSPPKDPTNELPELPTSSSPAICKSAS